MGRRAGGAGKVAGERSGALLRDMPCKWVPQRAVQDLYLADCPVHGDALWTLAVAAGGSSTQGGPGMAVWHL